MDFSISILIIFSGVVIYYLYEIIKHLIHLQKLQLDTNNSLYELNSKLSVLIQKLSNN
jgi:hypothetical protein